MQIKLRKIETDIIIRVLIIDYRCLLVTMQKLMIKRGLLIETIKQELSLKINDTKSYSHIVIMYANLLLRNTIIYFIYLFIILSSSVRTAGCAGFCSISTSNAFQV